MELATVVALAIAVAAIVALVMVLTGRSPATLLPLSSASSSAKSRTLGKDVVLVGAPNAGKSALLHRLATSTYPTRPTAPSLVENRALVKLDDEDDQVTIIDCPGHARLLAVTAANLALDASTGLPLPGATAPRLILVVVDATMVVHAAAVRRDAAERLAMALDSVDPALLLPSASSVEATAGDRIRIVATKADDPLAASPVQIRTALQDELHALRVARASSVSALNTRANNADDNEDDGRRRRNQHRHGTPQSVPRISLADLGIADIVVVSAKSNEGTDNLRQVLSDLLAA
ncbi:hypothetical protein BC828DRAFT_385332 [Blastocladiella britannica]|nr:hypothetical protein BC828DRAFT_385332 [Blastocladiella britannica]